MNLPEPCIITDCVSSPYGSSLQDDNDDDYLSTTANVSLKLELRLWIRLQCNFSSLLTSEFLGGCHVACVILRTEGNVKTGAFLSLSCCVTLNCSRTRSMVLLTDDLLWIVWDTQTFILGLSQLHIPKVNLKNNIYMSRQIKDTIY